MLTWLTCLIVALVAGPGLAGDVTLLHVRQGQQIGQGTAFKIGCHDGRDYYLTAGHNLRSATAARIARDGRWQDVDVIAWSLQPDLGVVALPTDGQPPFQLSASRPVCGRELQFSGYGHGVPRVSRGAVTTADARNGQILASIPVYPGDSGGPLHVRGEICYGLVTEWLPDPASCGPAGPCLPRQTRNIGCRAVDSVTIAHWIRDRCPQAYYHDSARPSPTPEPLPAPPATCPDPIRPAAGPDARAALALILARLDSGELRGPAGPPGPVGPTGPAGSAADPAAIAPRVVEVLRRDYPHLFEPHSGVRGDPGPPGPPGTVTVIVRDNGQEIHRAEHVPAGKTIVVPIERTEKVR